MRKEYVRHQGDINLLVSSSVKQFGLSSSVLLRGCAEQLNATANSKLLLQMAQSQKCRNAAGSNQIMSTGMSNVRQRVVFGIKIDQATFCATNAFEAGLDTVGMSGHGEALAFQEVADVVVSLVLFVRKFGVGPDLYS